VLCIFVGLIVCAKTLILFSLIIYLFKYLFIFRIITLPSFRIKIQFTSFNLVKPDPQSGVCRLQWVSIIDGDLKPEAKRVKLCGISPPGTFVSSGMYKYLKILSKLDLIVKGVLKAGCSAFQCGL